MNDKWVVEGYLMPSKKFVAFCKDSQEADKLAKSMALEYKGKSFNVTGPNDTKGLTDHHYKWDDYFKDAVQFTHND